MKQFCALMSALMAGLVFVSGPNLAFAKTYDEAYQKAKVAFEAKNYSAARTFMQDALKLATTPHDKNSALIRIGETYNQEKNINKALEVWKEALAVPNLEEADRLHTLMTIGSGYDTAQKPQLVREYFFQVLESPQVSIDHRLAAQMAIGKSWMDDKKFGEARTALNKVVFNQEYEAGAKFIAQMWIGMTYSKENKPERAREEFVKLRDAVEGTPAQWAMTQIFIGTTYTDEKKYEQARAELMKVIFRFTPPELSANDAQSLDVAKVGAYREVVNSYIKEKNLTQARLEFEKFCALLGATPEMKASLQKELDELAKAPPAKP